MCLHYSQNHEYNKTCLKRPLKKNTQNWFSSPIIAVNAGQKYCRILQWHSAILPTFIKLTFVIKIFVLSILSRRVRQVLLYNQIKKRLPETFYVWNPKGFGYVVSSLAFFVTCSSITSS